MASSYAYTKKCIEERKLWVNAHKTVPCVRCGKCYHPACMDFHHLDRSTKKFGIGSGLYRQSRAAIEREIAKCVVMCANCHRLTEFEIAG
jgi:hypothetical protein